MRNREIVNVQRIFGDFSIAKVIAVRKVDVQRCFCAVEAQAHLQHMRMGGIHIEDLYSNILENGNFDIMEY